jgi:hypothetical protein
MAPFLLAAKIKTGWINEELFFVWLQDFWQLRHTV